MAVGVQIVPAHFEFFYKHRQLILIKITTLCQIETKQCPLMRRFFSQSSRLDLAHSAVDLQLDPVYVGCIITGKENNRGCYLI